MFILLDIKSPGSLIMSVFFFFFQPLKSRIYDPDKLQRCRFFEFFPLYFAGHKCDILGVEKNLKKRHAVLGSPDKSKI